MAVKIRLRRMGSKKRPFYRFIVADSRSPRNGRFIEELGFYNPIIKPVEIKLNEEKAIKWLRNGATPTDTVRGLFNRLGVIEKSKDKSYTPEENSIIHVGKTNDVSNAPLKKVVKEESTNISDTVEETQNNVGDANE